MRTILAGWIAGYVMSISVTISLVWMLLRTDSSGLLGNYLDPDVDQRISYVFLHLGASLLCTIVGIIIGAVYHVAIIKRLGAESFAFGFFITLLILVLVTLIILISIWPKRWFLWATQSLFFIILFGLMVPLLASL